jgi:hypothetical protein
MIEMQSFIVVLFDVMRKQYDTFMALTTRLAGLHDQVQHQKDIFRRWKRLVAHDETADPFSNVQPAKIPSKTSLFPDHDGTLNSC